MDNVSGDNVSGDNIPGHNVFAITPFATLSGQPVQDCGNADVLLSPLPHCVKVNLRGQHATCSKAIAEVSGIELPEVPNTCQHGDRGSLFWLGPDEWQFRAAGDGARQWVTAFRAALQGVHSAVVDVSDYYALMSLRGPLLVEVMEKLTPLDIRALLSESQRCAQTRFANAPVLVHRAEPGTMHIQVRWSYAEYLWTYLQEAMHEFN